ncbi:MAG: PTS sugar transporter subunit IIA, partial [Gallionellaceae bacterium CG_4_10_14_3_um_filter_60_1069]
MSLIGKYLTQDCVLLDRESTSKKRVFEHIGILFENTRGIARAEVFDSLFAREKLGSTGLGQGVAIPHGRVKGLKDAMAAFVKMEHPIPF